MIVTDEMLMAYADGELSGAEASAVERAISENEDLAARVALFADSRDAVRQAYEKPPIVPADLEARVRAMAATAAALQQTAPSASNVIDLAARRRVVPFWQLPAAAAVALAIGLGSAWLTGQGSGSGGLQVAGLGDPAIVGALATVASGERVALGGGANFAAIATFRDGDNSLCREFEHDREGGSTVVAVACRTDNKWEVRFAIAAAAADAEGYAPVSSLETLDAYLSATGAGAPLSTTDEAAALELLD